MPPRPALLAPLAGLLLGAACAAPARSGETELERLYLAAAEDTGGGSAAEQARAEARRTTRIRRVLELLDGGAEPAQAELLFAAAVLLDSSELSHLARAEDLALEAALLGDERGFPLAAEAIDRQCLVLGQPQRYGTQYLWSGGRWTLYPTDPATSDAERVSMGVPPLAEAKERATLLPTP